MHHFAVRSLTPASRILIVIFLVFGTAEIALSQGNPQLRISDVTLSEGDNTVGGFATELVQISLSAASAQDVKVTFSTQPGTAQSDIDFFAVSIEVTIPAGSTSILVSASTKGDTAVEGTEEFFLNLSNPVNAIIADGQAVATIIDDDALMLLTQPSSQRAAALDSVIFTQETFPIINTLNFSSDSRTRISVFAIGLKLGINDTASAVTASAEDSLGTLRPLEVEFVSCAGLDDRGRLCRPVPKFFWLTQVVLKLNEIPALGDVKIRVSLHGQTSNAVLVGIKPL